jgi:hypothetical protein
MNCLPDCFRLRGIFVIPDKRESPSPHRRAGVEGANATKTDGKNVRCAWISAFPKSTCHASRSRHNAGIGAGSSAASHAMIVDAILILGSAAVTVWVGVMGFTGGWTWRMIGLLILGLLTVIGRVDSARHSRRKRAADSRSANDSKRA